MRAGLASQSESSSRGGASFSSGFMNMPPTQYQGFDDGYRRLGWVPYERPGLKRNRYKPIMTWDNPGGFVGGPRNNGLAPGLDDLRGKGSVVTASQPYSGGSGNG